MEKEVESAHTLKRGEKKNLLKINVRERMTEIRDRGKKSHTNDQHTPLIRTQ